MGLLIGLLCDNRILGTASTTRRASSYVELPSGDGVLSAAWHLPALATGPCRPARRLRPRHRARLLLHPAPHPGLSAASAGFRASLGGVSVLGLHRAVRHHAFRGRRHALAA